MKTSFTLLRNCICVIIFTLSFTASFSQISQAAYPVISDIKVAHENNNLIINWNVSKTTVSDYCEVQASTDGKTFFTIGLVLGADPKQNNNSFIFKQNLSKLKAGLVYYRILSVENYTKAFVSNVVKASI